MFTFFKLIRSNLNIVEFLKLSIPFTIILSLSVKRVSDNFVFSRFTKHGSMIVDKPKCYRELDYINHKDKVSQKLREGFIEGVINISKISKTLKFSTHKWFVDNVVLSEEVKSVYDIKITEAGETKIPLEILTLIDFKELMRMDKKILDSVFRKRKGYKVALNKK